uniref:transmembrane protein 170B-like n=1 Tax=Ciona intestinalis TaxID=7719 RepID=UPI0005213303|nr:transmembrane protein 170B-like [Ciona intestinalis]|eukprot:XP_009858844.1 transmembrane protein 170B-like [Ciona intestinalis]
MTWNILSTEDIKGFENMTTWIFLWVLVSSVIVHGVAALASFLALHKNKQGRWYSLAIIAMGFIMPLTGGILSCVSIAGVYQSLGWSMAPRMALIWGGGQTVLVIWISLSRLLPTI